MPTALPLAPGLAGRPAGCALRILATGESERTPGGRRQSLAAPAKQGLRRVDDSSFGPAYAGVAH